MNGIVNPLIDNAVQCWGCPVFDRLFQVVSMAAGAVYGQFAFFCMILFCVLFAFYVLNAVWKNIKDNVPDPWYKKSVQPAIISSLFALTFLGMGVMLPRFVTTLTFEPVAQIALTYTQSVVQMDAATIEERVTYQPMPMSDAGFYRPQLRDAIIMLMKTTITQFQAYIKLGIAVMDSAFTWRAMLGVGALLKHIIIFFMGLYLVYGFFRLFVRFCFYFADIIVAMTLFAFFFPLSLVMFVFRGGDAPSWMKNLGKTVGVGQFKRVIKSIVALASGVLTYTVVMVIIAKFFTASGGDGAQLMHLITNGDVFAADLSDENLAALTLMGCVVLVYVVNFITGLGGQVTKMVLDTFDVGTENQLSEQLATDAEKLTKVVVDTAKKVGQTIINGGDGSAAGKTDKK